MNELLAERISKAEGDYGVAKREMDAKESNYDAICFHCPQMAEKYVKAFLFKNNVEFPKIHSLIELLELCYPIQPALKEHRKVLNGWRILPFFIAIRALQPTTRTLRNVYLPQSPSGSSCAACFN